MATHQERRERMERHLRMMDEFMIAEIKDNLADAQQSLDDAVANGRELSRKRYEGRLAELKEMLRLHEDKLRAA